jgi:hypothetical protein
MPLGLPTELWPLVFASFVDDWEDDLAAINKQQHRAELRAVTLTSKVFYQTGQPLLFTDVALDLEKLSTGGESPESEHFRLLKRPTIAAAVRAVKLYSAIPKNMQEYHNNRDLVYTVVDVLRWLATLPNLRNLLFRSLLFLPGHMREFAARKSWPFVTFSNCGIDLLPISPRVIQSYPTFERLELVQTDDSPRHYPRRVSIAQLANLLTFLSSSPRAVRTAKLKGKSSQISLLLGDRAVRSFLGNVKALTLQHLGSIDDGNASMFDHFKRLEDIQVTYGLTRTVGTPTISAIPPDSLPALRCFRGALHDVQTFVVGRPVTQVMVTESWQHGVASWQARANRWTESTKISQSSYIPFQSLRTWSEGIARLPEVQRLTLPADSLDEVVLSNIAMCCPNLEWMHFVLGVPTDSLVCGFECLEITPLTTRRVSDACRNLSSWPICRRTEAAQA